MKLILARVLPVAIALLVPSLAFAEEAQDKPAAAQVAHHGSKRAKAAPKARKPAKAKAGKSLRKSAKNPAKLSKRASAR